MKNQCVKIVMAVFLSSLMAWASPFAQNAGSTSSPVFEEHAPPSLADHLHLSKSKDPIDGGWLPNLTGLPNEDLIAYLSRYIVDVMQEEKDPRCTAVDFRLRLLAFQHFMIHQHMANAQNVYFTEEMVQKWAHMLGMILKESSGDSTSITDMTGRSVTTNLPRTNLENWRKLLRVVLGSRIKFNVQTNFGLTQTSADRLFLAFHLAKNQNLDTELLEGKEGAATPRKIPLNTAIAIRRLVWFYQDFAQGRLSQDDQRIAQEDIVKPEYYSRYRAGLRKALLYCGTLIMFQPPPGKVRDFSKLEDAMASIAYCKLGNARAGYGKNEFNEECFAQWVTLCPALNFDIAMLTPMSYFATRGQRPVCVDTFRRLINPKPTVKTNQ